MYRVKGIRENQLKVRMRPNEGRNNIFFVLKSGEG